MLSEELLRNWCEKLMIPALAGTTGQLLTTPLDELLRLSSSEQRNVVARNSGSPEERYFSRIVKYLYVGMM